MRVLRAGGSHGRFSLLAAGLAVAGKPLDRALRGREQEIRTAAEAPRMPVVLVCGPPRSGTTLMAQSFLRATSAAYVTNVMDMFPRSPLAASRLLGVRPRLESVPLTSHYGRVAGFSNPNDALSLWDAWLGSDRTRPDGSRAKEQAPEMKGFFGALEAWTGRFVATKNNALNAVATEVGEAMPTAQFICMKREDVYLAQSLLVAREYIHGDPAIPYGLHPAGGRIDDTIADVVAQVVYHRELAASQAEQLGPDRFQVIEYERLCTEPRVVVAELARAVDANVDVSQIPDEFPESRRVSLEPRVFEELRERLST